MSTAYLEFIRAQPCVVCGRIPCQPHHVRTHGNHGVGKKPGDHFCIPLCPTCHRNVHQYGAITYLGHLEITGVFETLQRRFTDVQKSKG